MAQQIYFTRHGEIVGTEDCLSQMGRDHLDLVAEKLKQKGLTIGYAFVTDKERTLQTANQLAPNAFVARHAPLRASGNSSMVLRYSADPLLEWILARLPATSDGLVVGHDAVPAVLALRLAETRGAVIDWKDRGLLYQMVKLKRGHGVLVVGSNYEFMSP